MGELFQKRVSLAQVVLVFAGTALASVAGSVAWATQFQTKTIAASSAIAQDARISKIEKDQTASSARVESMHDEITEVRDTTNRLDEKLDKVLLRLSVRR